MCAKEYILFRAIENTSDMTRVMGQSSDGLSKISTIWVSFNLPYPLPTRKTKPTNVIESYFFFHQLSACFNVSDRLGKAQVQSSQITQRGAYILSERKS